MIAYVENCAINEVILGMAGKTVEEKKKDFLLRLFDQSRQDVSALAKLSNIAFGGNREARSLVKTFDREECVYNSTKP